MHSRTAGRPVSRTGRDSIAGRVLLKGGVVHITDIRADPDFALAREARALRARLVSASGARAGSAAQAGP